MIIEPLPDPQTNLIIWTVYDHPSDYPEYWVVRPCWVDRQRVIHHGPGQLAKSLEMARELVPPGLHRQGRRPNDDPVIVEVWF